MPVGRTPLLSQGRPPRRSRISVCQSGYGVSNQIAATCRGRVSGSGGWRAETAANGMSRPPRNDSGDIMGLLGRSQLTSRGDHLWTIPTAMRELRCVRHTRPSRDAPYAHSSWNARGRIWDLRRAETLTPTAGMMGDFGGGQPVSIEPPGTCVPAGNRSSHEDCRSDGYDASQNIFSTLMAFKCKNGVPL
jgi:hypothetical protein